MTQIPRTRIYQILSRVTMAVAIFLVIAAALPATPDQPESNTQQTDLNKFFHEYANLTDDQIKEIQNGEAVAQVLKSPSEDVLIFGAVYVKANPESYLT